MTENEKKVVKMEDVQAKAEEKQCPVQQALVYVEEFLAGPMCGRCFPCSMGSYEARIRLTKLVDGSGTEDDLAAVRRIMKTMTKASMCKKGKDTAKFILDNIDSDDFRNHLTAVCASNECTAYVNYIITPEKCNTCGDCLDACKDFAIFGEKRKTFQSATDPFEIVQKRCTKCGECIKVCPEKAIIIISSKEMAEKETVGV